MIKTSEKKGRIQYLDIARGLAIFGMFTQHSMLVHEVSGGEGEGLLVNLCMLLGTAPSAPVFMILMGVFLMKSKSNMRQNIWRGFKLLILGFILNLLRFIFPLLIVILLTDNNNLNLGEGETPLELLFYVDIFQLAGLSLIFCVFFKKITERKFVVPGLIVSILLVAPFLWGKFDNNLLFHFLWGDGNNVSFPLFPWVIYPILGMYLSRYLIEPKTLKKNLKNMRYYGFILTILGLLIVILSNLKLFTFDTLFPNGDYERSGLGIHLLIIGFVLLWFNACYGIEQKFGVKNPIIKVLIYWSRNVTAIYFIQWVLFGWSILIFDFNQQDAVIASIIGLVVLLSTHFSVKKEGVRKLFAWI
ncbi:MAG: acyltransferase [Xenococcus sp. (in: cyanobacteria)]